MVTMLLQLVPLVRLTSLCPVTPFTQFRYNVSELSVFDSISARGCILDSIEESLPPSASALGFLTDRLTIGWEKLDMAGVDEILMK